MTRMLVQRCPWLPLFGLLCPALAAAQTEADPPAGAAASPVEAESAPLPAPPAAVPAADTTGEGSAPAGTSPEADSVGSTDPPRKMDLSVPPPPPPRSRQARMHNGFYLRSSFGAGGLWPSIVDRSDGVNQFDLNGSTFSLNLEGLVGASPADGFAIGGGLAWAGSTSGIQGDGVDASVNSLLMGIFFDAFPRPNAGMHLGAMAGYAMHMLNDHPSGVKRTGGLGGAAWLGYDWWVSDELSAGLMLRFNGALTQGDNESGSVRVNSTGLSLLATALYH